MLPVKLILKHTFKSPSVLFLVILGMITFGEALMVVYVKDKHRFLTMTYHHLQKEQRQLDARWSQLLIERGTWGSSAHIEQAAQQYLNMELPKGKTTRIIDS